MLGLLLCAIIGEWFQPGVVSQAHSSLAVRTDRLYKDAPVNFFGQLFITLFRIGTLALALCLCWPGENAFTFTAFAVVCGMTIALLILKMLCHVLLDYTFQFSRRFGAPYEYYGNLFTLIALVLYPALLVLLRVSSPHAARWIVGIVMSLFILLWAYRTVRTYAMSPMALVYILLYICTLEIMPYVGLAYLSAKTIDLL